MPFSDRPDRKEHRGRYALDISSYRVFFAHRADIKSQAQPLPRFDTNVKIGSNLRHGQALHSLVL